MILSLLSNGAGGFTLTELKSVLHHNNVASLNNEFKALTLLLNVRLRRNMTPNFSQKVTCISKYILGH